MCQAAPESQLQNFDFCKQVHVTVANRTGHGETIYTTKIHKFFKLGLFKELFANIYKHTNIPLQCIQWARGCSLGATCPDPT